MQELKTDKAKQIIHAKQDIEQDKLALGEETRKIWAGQDEMGKKHLAANIDHWAKELKSLKLARTEAGKPLIGMEIGKPGSEYLSYKMEVWGIKNRLSQLQRTHYELAAEMEVKKRCLAKERSLKLQILHDHNISLVCEGVRIMNTYFRVVNDNIDILPAKDEFTQAFQSMASQMHVKLQSLREALSDLYALDDGTNIQPDDRDPWRAITKLQALVGRSIALVDGTSTQADSTSTQADGSDEVEA
jgi:hypothetical protein